MAEKITITQKGEPTEDGKDTVVIIEANIVSKTRYTKEQLTAARDSLQSQINQMSETIDTMD
jgi:hypothetical protein